MRYATGIIVGALAGAAAAVTFGVILGGVTRAMPVPVEGYRATLMEGALTGLMIGAAVLAPPAAIIGGIAGGLWVRHRMNRRARRGCCRTCGYELRGLPACATCPECGRQAIKSN